MSKGTLELDATGNKLVESDITSPRTLNKAVPVSAVSIDGKRYYKVLSYTDLSPEEEMILDLERSNQVLSRDQQKKLDKLKASQTFYIPDNETTRNQVWGVIGVPGGTANYDKIMNQYLPAVGAGSQGVGSKYN